MASNSFLDEDSSLSIVEEILSKTLNLEGLDKIDEN